MPTWWERHQDGLFLWDRAGNRNIVRGPSMQINPCAEEHTRAAEWAMQSRLQEYEFSCFHVHHDYLFLVVNILIKSGFLTVADVFNLQDTDVLWCRRLNAIYSYMKTMRFAETASVAADPCQMWRVNLSMGQLEEHLRQFRLLIAPVFAFLLDPAYGLSVTDLLKLRCVDTTMHSMTHSLVQCGFPQFILAFITNSEASWTCIRDRVTCMVVGAVRSFYLCQAGTGSYRCNTLILCKHYRDKSKLDRLGMPPGRLHCVCGAMYKRKWGKVVQITNDGWFSNMLRVIHSRWLSRDQLYSIKFVFSCPAEQVDFHGLDQDNSNPMIEALDAPGHYKLLLDPDRLSNFHWNEIFNRVGLPTR